MAESCSNPGRTGAREHSPGAGDFISDACRSRLYRAFPETMNAAPDFKFDNRTLRFTGELTLARLGDLPQRLATIDATPAEVDLSGVDRIDTVGAWLVHRIVRDHDAKLVGADEDVANLLQQLATADKPLKIRP